MIEQKLSRYLPADDSGYSDAWRRVWARLDEYVGLVLRAWNIRPDTVTVLDETQRHILVRLSSPLEHVVLRLAPESELTGEVYFGRTMTTAQLPAVRIIQYDLSNEILPCHYTVESYAAGGRASRVGEAHQVRSLGRQIGRVLRRMHRLPAAGWGRPATNLRHWPQESWRAVLAAIHSRDGGPPTDAILFSEAERALLASVLEDPALEPEMPVLIHGAVAPETIYCTIGEHPQIEALVEPGACIGGDAMFDLAQALDPALPPAWREGLWEGYLSMGALTTAQAQRLRLMELCTCYWSACRHYARAAPHEAAFDRTRQLIAEL
jgi:hypothetical protein